MNFKPLFNNILVKRIEEDNKTAGGIIIPDNAKEKPSKGTVISVGEGAFNDASVRVPVQVKSGDTVMFSKWSGSEVKLDGEDFIIMKDTDVLGIIE